ncbi:hypothetical protein [Achromobacter sp. Marseille-Q4962]|uniref:hypothetical protein n=1 Tax=Achromobacter sp. Marseille-Q4962 TaxID=2942202 RepID=UPI00207403CD|nr:hypothetical protein [Achromobacter sp. Marseille-Q4962]
MKIRAFSSALALAAGLACGAAQAQSAAPTTPSTTPNDSTGAQPNRPLPAGQPAPAPSANPSTATTPPRLDQGSGQDGHHMRSDRHAGQMPHRQREANDNVPATPSGGAAPPPGYPNTGGSQ